MKKLNKTIEEKYNNLVKDESNKLAKFLKRRRIELGLTLESVSEGICSTSYLSKIENCQVEVDATYFTLLFEKLDLDYDKVLETRNVPIYQEVIKAYLNNDKAYIKNKVNLLVDDNNYCETEVELLVLFYSLMENYLKEAKKTIQKIELTSNTLLEEELQIFAYLTNEFYYRCGSIKNMLKGMSILKRNNFDNELLRIAYLSTLTNYYYELGDGSNFNYYYQKIKNSDYAVAIPRVLEKCQLQELCLRSKNALDDMEEQFKLIKETISENNADLYEYYYNVHLIIHEKYEDVYNNLNGRELSQELMALLGLAVDKLQNMGKAYEYLKVLREYTIKDHGFYSKLLEYLKLKLEQYSYGHLFVYLKNVLLSNDLQAFIYDVLVKDFFYIAYELGKYKEIVRFLNRKE